MAHWKQVLDEKARKDIYLMENDEWRANIAFYEHNRTYACAVRGVDEKDMFDLSAEQVEQHFNECNIDLNGNWV